MFRFTTIFILLGILALLLFGMVMFLMLREEKTSPPEVRTSETLPQEAPVTPLQTATTSDPAPVPQEKPGDGPGLGTDLNMEFPTLDE